MKFRKNARDNKFFDNLPKLDTMNSYILIANEFLDRKKLYIIYKDRNNILTLFGDGRVANYFSTVFITMRKTICKHQRKGALCHYEYGTVCMFFFTYCIILKIN